MVALKLTVSLITIVDNDYVIFSYKKFHKTFKQISFYFIVWTVILFSSQLL